MKRLNFTSLALLLLLAVGLGGCDGSPIALFATPTPTVTATFTPTPTNTPTNTPTPTSTPTSTATPTPTPTPLSAADIFAFVSPSVAFIETPAGTGSGVLIEDGYVVTNAHVVWPFQKVRVVFSDGSEHLDAPVLNWDLLGDLAVIGPIQTSISPVSFEDGEDLIIGSETFLIGYPGEAEQFPQPTFTQGLISRIREWKPIEMTYFQTDALIARGQSGGVLVSKEGAVIGISTFSFTEAGFGLVASAADVLPRVESLIAGEDVDGLGDRHLPIAEGQLEYELTLRHDWDAGLYILNEPAGTTVDIEVDGENDAAFGFFDVFGQPLIVADETESGIETASATTELAAPYFVVLAQYPEESGDFKVRSNRNLVPLTDVDDGIKLSVGQTLLANLDYPRDSDYFVIDLEAGDIININIDSVRIDPFLIIDYPEATDEQVIFDDNSGGGPFGINAQVTYQAPHSGSYFIVVEDASDTRVGGYILSVGEAPLDATPVAPPPTPTPTPTPESTSTPLPPPTPTPIPTPAIPMALYESDEYPFAIQYPAQWVEQPKQEGQGSTLVSYIGDNNAEFGILKEDWTGTGFGELTLEEYVDLVIFNLSQFADVEITLREQMVNAQGFQVEIIEYTAGPGIFKSSQLIYVHKGTIGLNVTYFAPRAKHQELEPVIDFSFNTFQVTE